MISELLATGDDIDFFGEMLLCDNISPEYKIFTLNFFLDFFFWPTNHSVYQNFGMHSVICT